MKKHFAIALILAITSICFAAGSDNQKLRDVCAMLSEHPVTKGNFTQIKSVKTAKGSRDIKSSGELIFCPD